jgi:hypothetical protein
MSLKIENSRRVAKSRSVCMDLKTGFRRRRIALFYNGEIQIISSCIQRLHFKL